MQKKSIGVFDSGFGGIDILRGIVHALPEYNYIYLGDTARTPYGTRSQETIYEFTRQAVEFLFKQNCDLVILACNTASTVALRRLQQEFLSTHYPDKKVLGVLIPAVEAAIEATQNGKIGVLATEATVTSCAFPAQLEKTAAALGVKKPLVMFQKSATLLAPIVEAEDIHPEATTLIINDYVAPLLAEGIDTLVLGCTHYGILEAQIATAVGPHVTIISEGRVVPEKLAAYLKRHKDIADAIARNGQVTFYTTDLTNRFQKLGSLFFGREITPHKVQL